MKLPVATGIKLSVKVQVLVNFIEADLWSTSGLKYKMYVNVSENMWN